MQNVKSDAETLQSLVDKFIIDSNVGHILDVTIVPDVEDCSLFVRGHLTWPEGNEVWTNFRIDSSVPYSGSMDGLAKGIAWQIWENFGLAPSRE